MKILFSLALVAFPFLSVPAQADIRYPNLAGSEYCSLRSAGVSHDEALTLAVEEGYDYDYVDAKVTVGGNRVSRNSVKMAQYINTMCPELFN